MSGAGISEQVRHRVATHFEHRCAYCRSPLFLFSGSENIEHIVPRCAEGSDDEENLCLSCSRCNLRKAARVRAIDPVTRKGLPLFHPRDQRWSTHFEWAE